MVRVLCYGHKSCKFDSYTRLIFLLLISIDDVALIFLLIDAYTHSVYNTAHTSFLLRIASEWLMRQQETLLRDM
jgi:hypothetical protein